LSPTQWPCAAAKNRDEFGHGSPEGIMACEVAMDAKDGSALLPTVAFGIPGSPDQAILLGAFILHGLQPGPLMIRDNMDIVYALLFGIVLSQVFLSIIGILIAPLMARISLIPSRIIAPFVLMLVFFGAYLAKGNIFDVGMALAAGLLGYTLRRFGFPLITVVMGFHLGAFGGAGLFAKPADVRRQLRGLLQPAHQPGAGCVVRGGIFNPSD
jgi:putative tricarboxylic transport membrane protein